MTIVWVTEFVRPPPSVTVRVSWIVLLPVESHDRVICTPVFATRPLPDVHEYDTIPWSSVDELALSTHVPGEHVTVYLATGG
jgi:hypothetical protein